MSEENKDNLEKISPDVICHAEIKADSIKEDADTGDLYIEGYASTKDIDETDDIVEPDAFKKSIKEFMNIPTLLLNHGGGGMFGGRNLDPIGKVVEAEIKPKGLWVKAFISAAEDKVRTKIKEGVYKAFSIGFRIIDSEPFQKGGKALRRITNLKLLEISVVGIPANRRALFSVSKAFELGSDLVYENAFVDSLVSKFDTLELEVKELKGVVGKTEKEDIEQKAIVPFKTYPLAPVNSSWSFTSADADKILGPDEDFESFKKVHTWYDSENSEIRSSYKLPHHKFSGGSVKTFARGVFAAMGALLGARGGVDIPANERKGVYNHLVKHYKEFEKEPPEFRSSDYASTEKYLESEGYGKKDIEELFVFKNDELTILEEVEYQKNLQERIEALEKEHKQIEEKAGRVLSGKNKSAIENALSSMEAAITALKSVLNLTEENSSDGDKKPKKEDSSIKSSSEEEVKEFDLDLEELFKQLQEG